MANRNKTIEMAKQREDSLKLLESPKLSADAAKAILRTILLGQAEFDLRLQELEREVGLSDVFISSSDIPTKIG